MEILCAEFAAIREHADQRIQRRENKDWGEGVQAKNSRWRERIKEEL
jgi:hypothetical protein